MNYVNQRPQGLGDIPRGLSAALPIAGPPGYAGEFRAPVPFYGKGGWLYLIGDTEIKIISQTTNGVARAVNRSVPTNSATGQLIVQEYRAATQSRGSGSGSTGVVGTITDAAYSYLAPKGSVLDIASSYFSRSGASGQPSQTAAYTTAPPAQTIAPPIITAPPIAPGLAPIAPPAPEPQVKQDQGGDYWWLLPVGVGTVSILLVLGFAFGLDAVRKK